MSELPHGTRSTYQRLGCRCVPCKAANAQYMTHLRTMKAKGLTPMGAHVPASETWRLIERLLIERFKKADIARELGLKRGRLELHTEAVTFRNKLLMRRLYRRRMLGEGPDQPCA